MAALATLGACSFDPSSSGGPVADDDSPDDEVPGEDEPVGDGEVGGDEPAPTPLSSCAAYLADDPASPSAVYTIDPGDGGALFDAYCEMELEDGGWTLALKADGRTNRFEWNAPYWTTEALFAADSPGLDHTEAKLDSFNRLPFTQVLVVFETPIDSGDRGWVYFDHAAGSLLEVFAGGRPTAVDAGRDTWLDAIPSSDLENDCDLEGFNVGPSVSRVRLGVVGAKESDGDCDARKDAISKLGIGGSMNDCSDCTECDNGSLSGPSVGNNQSGCDMIASFATVFVR
ncbi:MAG TPA: fibrinogen-like YCDxxxxGGGW domain-containing protein [Kofleriaceae bacterium]|nr:fibrinogen-like YCDxxxxGGGW domain-containing protein [Kofleriaceae bacterium]